MNTTNNLLKILGLLSMLLLESCSTVEGLGRDIQGLGKVIEKSSSSLSGSNSSAKSTSAPANNDTSSGGAVVTPVR